MSAQKPKPEQGANGRFLSGNSGGGRPKGSRNKLGDDFLKSMADDFEQHGAAVIQTVRETKPDVYLRVVADLLPKELKLERDPLENLTDEQLVEKLLRLRRQVDPILTQYRHGESPDVKSA